MRNGNLVCVQSRRVSQLENSAALNPPNFYEYSKRHEWLCHMDEMAEFAIKLVCNRDSCTDASLRQVIETGRALFLNMFRKEVCISRYVDYVRMNAKRDFQHFEGDLQPFRKAWIHLLRRSADQFLKSSGQTECRQFDGDSYISYTEEMLRNTRIAMDSSGNLCVVPIITEVGDVIYLLAGSSLPFVLRPVTHARRSLFEVVGPAYVHGIMDGELVYDSPKRVSTGDPDAYDAACDDIWLC